MKPKDTIYAPIIDIKGFSLRLENGYYSQPLPNQETPNFYSRFSLNPLISIYGLSFNSSIMTSTEDIINGRNISLYSFSLDKESIKEKLIKIAKQSEQLKDLDSLERLYASINSITDQVSNKKQTDRYAVELAKAKKNVDKAREDSSYAVKHRVEIERSKKLLEEVHKEDMILDSLENVKSTIRYQKQLLNNLINKGIKGKNIKPSDLNYNRVNLKNNNELLRKNQKQLKMVELLSNVRNFQFANVYPNYSNLAFAGYQVIGIDLEWNDTRKYFSTTVGVPNAPLNNLEKKKGKHLSGRFGLGNLDGNYGGLIISRTDVNDPSLYQLKGEKNLVAGIQLGSIKSGVREINLEHLYSTPSQKVCKLN